MKTLHIYFIILLSACTFQNSYAQIDLGDFFGEDKEEKPITEDELGGADMVDSWGEYIPMDDLNEIFGETENSNNLNILDLKVFKIWLLN